MAITTAVWLVIGFFALACVIAALCVLHLIIGFADYIRGEIMPKHAKSGTVTDIFAWLTPHVRGWLYTVAAAVIALLVGYGYLTDHQAALWLAVVAALCQSGLAIAHLPRKAVDESQ